MAATAQPGLAAGRRFGVEIGGACIAIALLLAWRRTSPDIRTGLLVAGIVLVTAAVLRPSLLSGVARRWLIVGQGIASVTTPVILSLIYFLVMTPLGLARRTFGRSPIRRDPAAASYWVRRSASTAEERRAAMEHQF